MANPPASVRRRARALWRATRIPAEVQLQADGRWKVWLASDRVILTGYYVSVGGGAYAWEDSTLEIDGAQVAWVDDERHLATVIADPDAHIRKGGQPGTPRLIVTPATEPEDAPPIVKHFDLTLVKRVPDGFITRNVDERGRWVISIALGEGTLHVLFDNGAMRSLQVETPEDVTRFTPSQLADALGLLAGTPNAPAAHGTPAVRDSTRSNSVEVRRATVIRN
jgi:hypothetical protein